MYLRYISLSLFCLLVSFLAFAATKPIIKGLDPAEAATLKYDDSVFLCPKSNKVIPIQRVNDDYCDCSDGSDEPGTSACPNGHFYCINAPHQPKKIFSSAVNDGICDCCDGSDEKVGVCGNTCRELAEETIKEQKELYFKYKKGLELKKQYSQESVEDIEFKREDLTMYSSQLDSYKTEKSTLEESRDSVSAREQERVKELKEAFSQTPEGQQIEKQSTENEAKEEVIEEEEEVVEEENFEEEEGVEEEEEEEEEEVVEEEEAEVEEQVTSSYNDKLNEYLNQDETLTQIRQELTEVNNKLEDINSKIRDAEKQISSINSVLAIDFGPNKEFYYLYGKCVSTDTVEYTYELCPFEKVTQKAKHGSSTSLGTWNSHDNKEWSSTYSSMHYKNGEKCWGGAIRNTKISLHCDSEYKLSDPQEPNRCEYSLKLFTPAACKDSDLSQLELQLQQFGLDLEQQIVA